MSKKDVEHISCNDISVFQNDIEYYISMFCEEQKIDDIRSIPQSVYNAMLMYVSHKYIKPSKILKLQGDIYNRYDIDQVEKLYDYYIYMCSVYNKAVSVLGFSYLSGIDQSVFYEWESNYSGKYDKASPERSKMIKKLRQARESSLSDMLLTGKNPVGILGILNHESGWNMPGVKESATKSAGTLADLQKKAGLLSDNSAAVPNDLAQNRIAELSDNSTQ